MGGDGSAVGEDGIMTMVMICNLDKHLKSSFRAAIELKMSMKSRMWKSKI